VIIPAKPPVSFFSSRSPVLDLFQGQLDYADHVRQDSEVVVLFFYAPWCGQSIAARAEIEQAASRLSDQVMCAFTQAVTVKSILEKMASQRNDARLAVISRQTPGPCQVQSL
jgi:thiol-disulfide isomerase/thioredoxin